MNATTTTTTTTTISPVSQDSTVRLPSRSVASQRKSTIPTATRLSSHIHDDDDVCTTVCLPASLSHPPSLLLLLPSLRSSLPFSSPDTRVARAHSTSARPLSHPHVFLPFIRLRCLLCPARHTHTHTHRLAQAAAALLQNGAYPHTLTAHICHGNSVLSLSLTSHPSFHFQCSLYYSAPFTALLPALAVVAAAEPGAGNNCWINQGGRGRASEGKRAQAARRDVPGQGTWE